MQIKENIKAPRHWPLWGEFTGTGEFPAQRASYAANVSIWWRHHAVDVFCETALEQWTLGKYSVCWWPGALTNWGWVMHICICKLSIIASYNEWLGAYSTPSHYLNQWYNIVNWIYRNKLQRNIKRNSYIFIKNIYFKACLENGGQFVSASMYEPAQDNTSLFKKKISHCLTHKELEIMGAYSALWLLVNWN